LEFYEPLLRKSRFSSNLAEVSGILHENQGAFRTVGSDVRSAATINTTQLFVSMATLSVFVPFLAVTYRVIQEESALLWEMIV
jgi:hypothetical protein